MAETAYKVPLHARNSPKYRTKQSVTALITNEASKKIKPRCNSIAPPNPQIFKEVLKGSEKGQNNVLLKPFEGSTKFGGLGVCP
eukprot:4479394-Amphidinium_carterae.1